jgi:hypothetical protein
MIRFFEWMIGNGIHEPAWVQVYWSAALTALSFATFLVLCLYAWDTRKLAKASVAQVENAQMPFLALVKAEKEVDPSKAQLPLSSHSFLAWAIQNQGNAAAVNIKVCYECANRTANQSNSSPESLNPISADSHTFIKLPPSAQIVSCSIEYESLDGRKYQTEITTLNNELHLVFHRL